MVISEQRSGQVGDSVYFANFKRQYSKSLNLNGYEKEFIDRFGTEGLPFRVRHLEFSYLRLFYSAYIFVTNMNFF